MHIMKKKQLGMGLKTFLAKLNWPFNSILLGAFEVPACLSKLPIWWLFPRTPILVDLPHLISLFGLLLFCYFQGRDLSDPQAHTHSSFWVV